MSNKLKPFSVESDTEERHSQSKRRKTTGKATASSTSLTPFEASEKADCGLVCFFAELHDSDEECSSDGSSTSESASASGSDDDDTSSSDGGVSSCDMSVVDVEANLCMESLSLMAGKTSLNAKEGQAAKNGKSAQRIRNTLKTFKCGCNCVKKVGFDFLMKLCIAFWSLDKASQDALLWSLSTTRKFMKLGHNSGGNKHYRKQRWKLHHVAVCRSAFVRFLGIGKSRLVRCSRTFRGMDGRSLRKGTRGRCVKSVDVACFLDDLYWSAGETLPHRFTLLLDFHICSSTVHLSPHPLALPVQFKRSNRNQTMSSQMVVNIHNHAGNIIKEAQC